MPGPNRAPRGGYAKPKNMGRTIRRLAGYLTRSKLPLLMVLLFLVLSVGTNLGGSYMMRSIINNFIWSGCTDFAGLAQAVLVLVVVYVAGCAAAYGQSAVMVRLAQRGVNRLRKDLFDKLQALPLSYFDQHPHGELMSRFTNDADNVQMALEQSVVSLCSSVLMFAGLVSMMLFINWKLFLVTALLLAVTIVLFKTLGGRSRKFYRAQQSALGNMNGEIQEIIEGLKVVKAFTHEEQAKADFRALNTAYRDAAQKANFYSIMIMPVSGNLMNISYALTAAFGGLLSVLQGFDLGGLVVYLNYSKQVGQPLNQISQQMTTLLSAMENPSPYIDDKQMKEFIGGGLGTPATRADIIEKLFSAFYVEKKGVSLVPTSKGTQVISLVPPDLKEPLLTAKWEQKLDAISREKADPAAFLADIRRYTKELVQAVKDSTESFVHDNVSQTPCPACGKLMLAVTGKKGRMLVCPDRECGHRQNVSMETNSRCPVCHKKLELFGDGDKQSYVCRCGFREKAEKFRERTGAGAGMSKRAVQQYLAKQEDAAPAVSAFALALQKAMEDKEK